jgi:G3E family GTPase
VAVLPEWCEPDRLRPAAPPVHVVTVVDAEHLLAGLATDDALRAVGLAEHDADDRTVGDLVARQIEQADTVVVTGAPAGGDDWEAGQLRALLHRLAPWAPRITPGELALPALARSPRRHPAPVPLRGLSGLPAGVHDPIAEYGVTSHVFTARRPFHPGRLHAAAGRLTGRVLRSRGHFWLANRPDDVLVWESAGRHTTGPATRWLAALPDEHWDTADPERRVAASFHWDPYYGDRHSRLVFVGIDLDTDDLQRTLTGCLLTDRELADGQDAWRDRPDPFGHRRTVTVQDGT